jgi:hypothetical protein
MPTEGLDGGRQQQLRHLQGWPHALQQVPRHARVVRAGDPHSPRGGRGRALAAPGGQPDRLGRSPWGAAGRDAAGRGGVEKGVAWTHAHTQQHAQAGARMRARTCTYTHPSQPWKPLPPTITPPTARIPPTTPAYGKGGCRWGRSGGVGECRSGWCGWGGGLALSAARGPLPPIGGGRDKTDPSNGCPSVGAVLHASLHPICPTAARAARGAPRWICASHIRAAVSSEQPRRSTLSAIGAASSWAFSRAG